MTQEELKNILQRAEELARNDFLQTEERYDVFLTCMKLFSYLLIAMEGDKDLLIHGNTDSYQWGYQRAVDNACEWLEHVIDNGAWIANDVGEREKAAIIATFKEDMEDEE